MFYDLHCHCVNVLASFSQNTLQHLRETNKKYQHDFQTATFKVWLRQNLTANRQQNNKLTKMTRKQKATQMSERMMAALTTLHWVKKWWQHLLLYTDEWKKYGSTCYFTLMSEKMMAAFTTLHWWVKKWWQHLLLYTDEWNDGSSSNWILMSCQPHRVTSGQSNSGHKQIHISKLFSHIYVSSQSTKPVTSQT